MRGTFFCSNLYFPNEKKNNIKLHVWIIMPSQKIFPFFPSSWIFMAIILLKQESMAAAAFNIEKLPNQLADTPAEKIVSIKGIGDSTAKKIAEMLETGKLGVLNEYHCKNTARCY